MNVTRARSEEGIAMIVVILVGMVVASLAAVAVTLSTRSLNSSAQHVTYESALHVAEHGVDQMLARVARLETAAAPYSAPGGLTAPAFATPAAEEAWATAELNAPTTPVQTAPDGQFAVIKPRNRNVIYAMSWLPSKANPRRTRLIKTEYLLSTYNPDNAILTDGDLDIEGGAAVGGLEGNIHSNGDIETSGAATTVSGTVTASGDYDANGGSNVAGVGGQPEQDVPAVEPEDLYALLIQDPANASKWYDLCPDGNVYAGSTSGPCDTSTPPITTTGWNVNAGGRWEPTNTPVDGVFFVHHGDVFINGSIGSTADPWEATIITNADPTPYPGACKTDFGDIDVRGGLRMVGSISGLAFIAGRDLQIQGTPSMSFGTASNPVLIAAREQMEVSGNATAFGSLIAKDECDTPGSPVSQNKISGSMILRYDGGLDVPLGRLARTVLWLEL